MKEKINTVLKSETFKLVKDHVVDSSKDIITSSIRTIFYYVVMALVFMAVIIIGSIIIIKSIL